VVERVSLTSGDSVPVLSFPHSEDVEAAVPSPTGKGVVFRTGSCAHSYFNEHLLVEDLQSGRHWTLGAGAAVCHSLSTPSWNAAGSRLVFVYGPSKVRGRASPRYGEGICTESHPGEVAVLPASGSVPLSKAHLIAPSNGCSYQSAVFDRQGIAAVEVCGRRTPSLGTGYLLQMNGSGHTDLRLALRAEDDVTSLASDPSAVLVLVTEDQSENAKPAFDWIWTFNGHRLHAVAHYNASVTAEPW
jgi:hypothetical protein